MKSERIALLKSPKNRDGKALLRHLLNNSGYCIRLGMNQLGRNLIAVTMASVLGLGVAFPGPAAERKTELSVIYDAPRLSVEARGVSLQRVLGEIGKKLGFVVVDYGGSDRLITFSLQDASAEEVLGQLLRGENYAVIYEGQRKEIAKVLLLTSAAQATQ